MGVVVSGDEAAEKEEKARVDWGEEKRQQSDCKQ